MSMLVGVPSAVSRVLGRGGDAEIVLYSTSAEHHVPRKRLLHVFDESERRLRVALRRRTSASPATLEEDRYLQLLSQARRRLAEDEVLSTLLHSADGDVWPSMSELENIVRLRSASAPSSSSLRSDFQVLLDDFTASGVYPLEDQLPSDDGSAGAPSLRMGSYLKTRHTDAAECSSARGGCLPPDEARRLSLALNWLVESQEVEKSKNSNTIVGGPQGSTSAAAAPSQSFQLPVHCLVRYGPHVTSMVASTPSAATPLDAEGVRLRPVHEDKLEKLCGKRDPSFITPADLCNWRSGWAMAPLCAANFIVAGGRIRIAHGVNITVCDAAESYYMLTVRPRDPTAGLGWWIPRITDSPCDPAVVPPAKLVGLFHSRFRRSLTDLLDTGRARWDGIQQGPLPSNLVASHSISGVLVYDEPDAEVYVTLLEVPSPSMRDKLVVLHGCRTSVSLPVRSAFLNHLSSLVPSLIDLEQSLTNGTLTLSNTGREARQVEVVSSARSLSSTHVQHSMSAAADVTRQLRDLFTQHNGSLTRSQIDASDVSQHASKADLNRALKELGDYDRASKSWKLAAHH